MARAKRRKMPRPRAQRTINPKPAYAAWYQTPGWKRLRAECRERQPDCVMCLALGKHEKGQHVDHIVPHKGDRALFFDETNLQHLCEWHHNSVKARHERTRWAPPGEDGWPEGAQDGRSE